MKLLDMSMDDIKKLTDDMTKQRKGIVKNALQISWHMRGGVNFIDVLNMAHEEIDALNEIIDSNMEVTKKTKLPFF
jgi:hypothetical protein